MAIKYLLVLGVVFVISLLFPNNAKFKYVYELGQNWNYEELKAPFDFPIKKTASELQREEKALETQFSPFYKIDFNIAQQQIQLFEQYFDVALEKEKTAADPTYSDVIRRPQRYVDYGKEYLEDLFTQGVIELNPIHAAARDEFVINIIEGNRTYSKTLENILDAEMAQLALEDRLPESNLQEPDFLLPLLDRSIVANLLYDQEVSEKERDRLRGEIVKARDIVKKGDIIVTRNAPISEDTYQKLVSFQEEYNKQIVSNKSHWGVYSGYLLLTSMIIGVFLIYLLTFSQSVFHKFNRLIFILMWIVLYSYLVFLVDQNNYVSTYIIPFAIVPIVLRTFFDRNLAFYVHIVIVLIGSFLSSEGYEFTFLQILVGVVVLLTDFDTRDMSKFFYGIFYIFLTYALGYLGLSLIKDGTLEGLDGVMYSWLFANVLLTLLAYPIIPLLERFFGFTSSITLMELTDMNKPLLRDLSMKAPGTLQHSLQVSNLAESAAQAIGANQLLVKVGALYHDIGKTKNANYFIENQLGDNPHKEIDHHASAKIIIDHVTQGVEMAKKRRLPTKVIDFIKTHHGTTRVEYFFRKYKEENPDEAVDEADFTYPGPKPKTKEQTILMLADSIEAACKSLKSPTEKDLYELVDKIVDGKIKNKQLADSALTFGELEQCVQIFKQVMKSVHHVRIKYPEEAKEAEKEIEDQTKSTSDPQKR